MEYRQDPTTHEWVIINPGREERPHDVSPCAGQKRSETMPAYDEKCPFCAGNEDRTPPEVYRENMEGRWALRVVPNKYAAVNSDVSPARHDGDLFIRAGNYGIAEVVVESPEHNKTLATMEQYEVERIVRAYHNRYDELLNSQDINFVTVFRNYGARAGTSLIHPHSQLIATPIIPPYVRTPLYHAMHYFDTYGRCVYCDTIQEEMKIGERLILETEHFVALTPFASRAPYEIRIYPKDHEASFASVTNQQMIDLADVLRRILRKIYTKLNDPDYNFTLYSAPYGDDDARYLHWSLTIIPRLGERGGFEISSGISINPITPEDCAAFLREEGDGGEGGF